MKASRLMAIAVVTAVLVVTMLTPAVSQDDELPRVALLDPGSEPRQLLRYDLTEGDTQEIRLSVNQDARMTMQGSTSPWSDPPTITSDLRNTVVAVNDDGTYELEQSVTDVEVGEDGDPAMADALRAQTATLVGMVTRARMDERGRKLSSETIMPDAYVAPPGVQPGMFDAQTTQVSWPVPEEPVGVGAVWEVRATTAAGGFEMTATSTLTLEELSPDGFTASVDLRLDAPPQVWALAGMPPGVEVRLDRMEIVGTGDVVVDLTRFALDSESEMAGSVLASFESPDESATMEMEMRIRAEVQPLER